MSRTKILSKGKRKQKTFRKKIMRGGDDTTADPADPVTDPIPAPIPADPVTAPIPADPVNPGFYGRNFLSEYINESDEFYNKFFKGGLQYVNFEPNDLTKANRLISDLDMLRIENDTPELIPKMEERKMFVKSMLLLDNSNIENSKKLAAQYRNELDEIRKKNVKLGENPEALDKTDYLLHFVMNGDDLTPAPLEKPQLEKSQTFLSRVRNMFSRNRGGKSKQKKTRRNKKRR